jgi:hypothetical protein
MTAPGFVAEASLYKSRTQYGMNASKFPSAVEAHIFPQARNIVGRGPGDKNDVCQKAGDLINHAWHESLNAEANLNMDEARAWRNQANEFITRSTDNWDCSFHVE